MTTTALLERLQGVREVGPNRWTARCPAHEDRSPSLSIAVTADGKTLIHCHAGCDTDDVLSAIGMTWKDLYPDDRWQEARARAMAHGSKRLQKTDAETAVERARLIIRIAAAELRAGKTHGLKDQADLALAVQILDQERAHG